MPKDVSYTAIDLLEKIIAFTTITPNPALWKEGLLTSSPPRLLRLRQINSLIKAIFSKKPDNFLGKAKSVFVTERTPSIKKLLSGGFLKDRKGEAYQPFITFMKDTVSEKEGELGEIGHLQHSHLEEIYLRLISYKKQLMALENFNAGWTLKNAVGKRFTVYITEKVTNTLEHTRADLDTALSLLVDPYTLTFTREELELGYNYPKEDISEIDKHFN